MEKVDYLVPKDLEPFINCVMVKESSDPSGHINIPLYADGYPGIMFQQADNGFYLLPRKKRLSDLFLYGQTLDPVSLDVKGPFSFVVFQLYPFASKYLLGVDPKELNDECYDLLQLQNVDVDSYKSKLVSSYNLEDKVSIISEIMLELIQKNRIAQEDKIQEAIAIIIKQKGQLTIKDLLKQIHVTERTLERYFIGHVGLTPKQFARIIQFQCSLRQLTQANFEKLVDIGIDSGFTDQSHFIRTFKKYTGQTPSYYLKQLRGA